MCVRATYVANVWPVTSVCSQNAVQHIMIWPALTIDKEIMKTMGQNTLTHTPCPRRFGVRLTLIHYHHANVTMLSLVLAKGNIV